MAICRAAVLGASEDSSRLRWVAKIRDKLGSPIELHAISGNLGGWKVTLALAFARLPGKGSPLSRVAAITDRLTHLAPEPGTVTLLDEGFNCLVFTLGDDTVIRVPKSKGAATRLARADAIAARLATILAVEVPQPRWMLPPGPALPYGASACQRIAGTPCPADATSPTLANDIGQALATLHAISPRDDAASAPTIALSRPATPAPITADSGWTVATATEARDVRLGCSGAGQTPCADLASVCVHPGSAATGNGVPGKQIAIDATRSDPPGPDEIAAERERVMAVVLPWLRDRQPEGVEDCVASWWADYRAWWAQETFEPRLVHGDFWFGNLLVSVDGDRLIGVLDLEQLGWFDPAQDLAVLQHGSPAMVSAVHDAYVAAGGTLDDRVRSRIDWHWQYREFTGLAQAIEEEDTAELADALDKIRAGPLAECFETAKVRR